MPEFNLDESDLRKPGWDEASGTWITLADGQPWLFPKPFVRLRPTRVEGRLALISATNFGSDFDAKVKAIDEDDDSVVAVFEVASDLLARNYDLTEEQRFDLLAWVPSPDAETGDPFLRTIVSIARGIDAPKLSTAGSDVPSSS